MRIPLLTFLLLATTIQAQEQKTDKIAELQTQILALEQKVKQQQNAIYQERKEYQVFYKKSSQQTDSLLGLIAQNKQNITQLTNELGVKIKQNETLTKDNFSKLTNDLSQNRLYWILVTLGLVVLGGFIYWLLGRKIKTTQTDVESQIRKTQKHLEEEAIKLDSKFVEVLETQLKIKQEEKTQVSNSNTDIDHSLALKVADEIVRIQKNISQMDSTTKGLKQLSASVKRIQDNFAANGYELVEMLGKEYNEGMKVVANFIPSEDLEKGQQIITRIIKPQVNFKGEMIQAAQIEVSVGE